MQAFKSADKRRTGTIPIKSLRDILETIQKDPLTSQQFYLITADADVENSGVLEIGEYLSVRMCHALPALQLHPVSTTDPGHCTVRYAVHASHAVLSMCTYAAAFASSGVRAHSKLRLQCCLAWKRLRVRKGKRMTKEVVETLTTASGTADPEQLDATLAEFDLDYSICKKMKQRQVALDDGAKGLSPGQLTAVMRRTND